MGGRDRDIKTVRERGRREWSEGGCEVWGEKDGCGREIGEERANALVRDRERGRQ